MLAPGLRPASVDPGVPVAMVGHQCPFWSRAYWAPSSHLALQLQKRPDALFVQGPDWAQLTGKKSPPGPQCPLLCLTESPNNPWPWTLQAT